MIDIIKGFCKVEENCDGDHSHVRGPSDVIEDTDQRRLYRLSFPISRLIEIPDASPFKVVSDLLRRSKTFETAQRTEMV